MRLPSWPCRICLECLKSLNTRELALDRAQLPHQRTDDGLHRGVDVGVGWRAIGRLESDPKGETHLASRNAFALIPIELAHVHQRHAGERNTRRSNRATNALGRQGVVDENRHVADDRWITRQRLREARAGGCLSRDSIEVEL